jgi:hypothetical protein
LSLTIELKKQAPTLTIGDSGDTITIPSGVTLSNSGIITNFESTGIDDNATSTAITIDSNSDVGINNTNPIYRLDVVGGTNTARFKGRTVNIDGAAASDSPRLNLSLDGTDKASIILIRNNDTLGIGTVVASDVYFTTNDTERMRITSTGNVGIGTSSPISVSSKNLTVSGSASASLFFDDTGYEASGNGLFSLTYDDGNLKFETASRSGSSGRTGNTERMRIDSSGNVGIGTASPSRKLHVLGGAGTAQIQSTTTASTLYFGDTNSTAIDNQGIGSLGTNIFILAGGSERMRIDSSGNVGIGTSSPAKALDVSGEIRASTGILFGADTASANTLDDYEEGTFTPVIAGQSTAGTGTYSNQHGQYTKVGDICFVNIFLQWSAHTGTGNMKLSNLPFTSIAGTPPGSGYQAVIPLTIGISFTGSIEMQLSPGSTDLYFYQNNNGSVTPITLDTVGTTIATFVYKTA